MITQDLANGAATQAQILVVEDDADMRELVRRLLEPTGHTVIEAGGGKAALRALYECAPALILLDVGLPDLDGWKTLERIRDVSDVPVLMLTGHGDELERVRGLNAGADDYLVKPFGRQELVARVAALLRRSPPAATPPPADYSDAFLTLRYAARSVVVDGRPVALTPLEFRLLVALVKHPDQVLERDQLLDLAWRTRQVMSDQVKLYVGYLRRKLGTTADGKSPIESVRGFGYRYRAS